MTQSDEAKTRGITFSREIRLGEVVAVLTFVGMALGIYTSVRDDVSVIKGEQRLQGERTESLRSEFRTASERLSVQVDSQGQAIRRIESRLDRARM